MMDVAQMARPEWVPEWLWEKYLQIKKESGDRPAPDAINPVLEKLFADQRCAVVWNAMTKRKGEEFRAFRAKNDFVQKNHVPDPYWDDVKMCLIRIPIMASGLREEDKVLPSKRAKQGEELARLARQLRSELIETRLSKRWPNPLSSDFGMQMYALTSSNHLTEPSKRAMEILTTDTEVVFGDLCDELAALASAAETWASWQSLVKHPNSSNADRLHFIRWMTDFFKRMYDSPLRESVAALTNVLFDCNLNAQDVAKLAP